MGSNLIVYNSSIVYANDRTRSDYIRLKLIDCNFEDGSIAATILAFFESIPQPDFITIDPWMDDERTIER